jgi:hypothetical protein
MACPAYDTPLIGYGARLTVSQIGLRAQLSISGLLTVEKINGALS